MFSKVRLNNFFRILKLASKRFWTCQCHRHASSLAFDTSLSLIPMIIISSWGISHIESLHGFLHVVQNWMVKNLLNTTDHTSSVQVYALLTQSNALPIFELTLIMSVVYFLWQNVEDIFSQIFQTQTTQKSFFVGVFVILVLFFTPILLAISFLLSSNLLGLLPSLNESNSLTLLKSVVSHLLDWGVSVVLLFAIYKWIPSVFVRNTAALTAAVLTWLNIEASKAILGWYLTNYSIYNRIYGAFSAIPFFLLWLYLAWILILFGASLTKELNHTVD